MKKIKIAGIVLFNPDSKRLRENITAVIGQVDNLILIENGSRSRTHLSEYSNNEKIIIVSNSENRGIAGALNQILQQAEKLGADWVLTLDQDSVIASNMFDVYNRFTEDEGVGMLTCAIKDRNFQFSGRNDDEGDIDFCISSGSYVRVNAWRQIKGFDESMFIDSVDLDFCLMLKAAGWRIFRTLETAILHEVGNSKIIKIFGKEYLALNHSLIRYYYIVRNIGYIGRKHKRQFKSFKIISRLFYTVLFFEHQRLGKLRNMVKGLISGQTCKINRNE